MEFHMLRFSASQAYFRQQFVQSLRERTKLDVHYSTINNNYNNPDSPLDPHRRQQIQHSRAPKMPFATSLLSVCNNFTKLTFQNDQLS
jgi:hypothetical protein